jgi:prepilin-type N-terminal cleavage/methylation domain-containing protein
MTAIVGGINMVRNLKNKSGFTLVELLVVVAIVGILASAGIPQYKRMVQKAKTSEGKVYLGSIHDAEAAFFAEFGAYGSNLTSMGVQAQTGANIGTYLAGFLAATCGAAGSHATAEPQTDPYKTAVNNANPSFFTDGNRNLTFGNTSRTSNCNVGTVAAGDQTYVATASGSIRQGEATADCGGATKCDNWTINENRVLSNIQSGVY